MTRWKEAAEKNFRSLQRTKKMVMWIRKQPDLITCNMALLMDKSYIDGMYKRSTNRIDVSQTMARYLDLSKDEAYVKLLEAKQAGPSNQEVPPV